MNGYVYLVRDKYLQVIMVFSSKERAIKWYKDNETKVSLGDVIRFEVNGERFGQFIDIDNY